MQRNILGDKRKSNFDDNLAEYVNKIYENMPDDFFPLEKNPGVVFSDYEVFKGKFVEQMPLLIEKNFVPVGFYDLMLKRVSVLGSKDEDFWWNDLFLVVIVLFIILMVNLRLF